MNVMNKICSQFVYNLFTICTIVPGTCAQNVYKIHGHEQNLFTVCAQTPGTLFIVATRDRFLRI